MCLWWLCAVEVQQQQNGQQEGVAGSQPAGAGPIEALASQLAAASANEQKQLLGERLYPLIQKIYPGSLLFYRHIIKFTLRSLPNMKILI